MGRSDQKMSDCASGLRGSLTARPCADSELARIHAGHPAGLLYAHSPTHNGIQRQRPEPKRVALVARHAQRAGNAQASIRIGPAHPTATPARGACRATRANYEGLRLLLWLLHLSRSCRRAEVERPRQRAARGIARIRLSGQGWPVSRTRPEHADPPSSIGRATGPGGLLLVTFLGRSRKVTRAPQARESF